MDVAGRADLGHGRRAGRARCSPPSAATSSRRTGRPWSAQDAEDFKAPIRAQYEEQGNAYYSTARLWDDGIIDPPDTRTVVGLALSVCAKAPLDDVSYGVFRM